MKTEFHVRAADFGRDGAAIRRIREMVFIHEQRVPAELEWDGLDEDAAHVLAELSNGTPVGTARLLVDGHIGRVAVLPAWRGVGVGTSLLKTLLDVAREQGHRRVFLGAQIPAIGFYERLGFMSYGEEFMDAGIAHRHMAREL